MATTNPDNIWTPDDGDDYALVTDLAAMADTIQAALNRGGAVSVANTTERGTYRPSPTTGARVFRRDVGWEETYYAASALSLGAAGWYPTGGKLPTIDSSVTASNSAAGAGGWTSKTGLNQLPTGAQVNAGGFTFGNTDISLPYSGGLSISGTLTIDGSTAGTSRGARILVGGRAYGTSIVRTSANGFSGSAYSINFSSEATYTAGEVINIQALQDSGGNLGITLPSLVIRYMGPV